MQNKRSSGLQKVDILLVHPPPWNVDRPSLGLATISSFLKNNGVKSHVLDLNIDLYHKLDDDKKFLFDMDRQEDWIELKNAKKIIPNLNQIIDEYVNKILTFDTQMIGFSVSNPKEHFTVELIRGIRNIDHNKLLVIGGPISATYQTRSVILDAFPNLNNLVFVVGEGEETILEIVNKVKLNKLLNTKGVIFVKDGKEYGYKPRKLIRNLDEIGYPDYQEFNLSNYNEKNAIEIEWSRGCLAHCVFCSVRTLQGHYRWKSAALRLKEIQFLYQNLGINTFSLCDSIINGNIKELDKFCDLIINSNLDIKWSGQITPRKEMTPELFNKMKEAGCYRLEFGAESGSNKILRKMRKMFDMETLKANLKSSKKSGIYTVIYLIVGFPGETTEDFDKTLDFIKYNYKNIDMVRSVRQLVLIPGTFIDENTNEYNIVRMPGDHFGSKWYTNNGNNYEMRMNRLEILYNTLGKFNIKAELTDIDKGEYKKYETDTEI